MPQIERGISCDAPSLQSICHAFSSAFFFLRACRSQICRLVVDRSADLAAACLSGVLEKTGMFSVNEEKKELRISKEYSEKDDYITVGIDGSVYEKTPGYKERMMEGLERILGKGIAGKVRLVHSRDGSGKGAALAVAAKLRALEESNNKKGKKE